MAQSAISYSSLVAALPAALVAAVASTPQGITSTSMVYVRDKQRAAQQTSEGWWRDAAVTRLDDVLGGRMQGHEFDLTLTKADGTRAQLVVWLDQIRAYFEGKPVPSGCNVVAAYCGEETFDLTPGKGPDVSARIRIGFAGVVRP